jgi:hypothetical protein
MVLPFFFPLRCFSGIAGPEETKNKRKKFLRLIQIRLATSSLEKMSLACQTETITWSAARMVDMPSQNCWRMIQCNKVRVSKVRDGEGAIASTRGRVRSPEFAVSRRNSV